MVKRLLLGLLLLSGLLLPGSYVIAQGGWSTPVQVSSDQSSSWFSDLAVSPDGSVHVFWSSVKLRPGQKIPDDVLMYRVLRDGVWSDINDVANPGASGAVVRTSIVMSRDSKLHALTRSESRIEQISAPWDRAWSALNWSAPTLLNNGRNSAYYVALATDQDGTLHAVWNEMVVENPSKTCPNCTDVYYRYSKDGGSLWSTPVNLSQMPEGSDKPQIKVDRNGGIHVAWDEGRDRYNAESPAKYGAYRYSQDGGLTWKDRVLFTLPDDAVQQTALALSAEGNPLVVYRSTETNLLYFQASPDRGVTWGVAAPVPGVRGRDLNDTPYDNYILDTDAAGNVHLVMVGFLAGDTGFQSTPRLLHLTWNGRTWSLPEVVVTDGRYPEWPRLVIDRGNTLHLTWFTRSEEDRYDTEEAIYRVWYSRKTLNAPETPALLLFTPAPTQTPTPISNAQSARLTPVATLPPELALAGGAVTQPKLDSDATVLLVVSAVPTILFAALIWILRRTRG